MLLDEQLAELPVEASSAFDGIPAVARDLSLHILSHRRVPCEREAIENVDRDALYRGCY